MDSVTKYLHFSKLVDFFYYFLFFSSFPITPTPFFLLSPLEMQRHYSQ